MGLGERGVRVLTGVADIYREAGGGDKGEKAVKQEFAKYTTGVSADEIEAANRRVLSEQQAEIEMRKLTLEVGQGLLPEIRKLIGPIRDLAPAFVNILTSAAPPLMALLQSFADFASACRRSRGSGRI
jgi:hypothetical protein